MQIYTVSQVTSYLRELLESDLLLLDLWVSGEVSNLMQSSAGHLYFTLKDADSQLRCVLFRRDRDGTVLENGTAVIAHGQVSIYETRGELQFYVDLVQPEGVGLLHLQFQHLKAELEEEGLFDPARKRPLPPFPERIGVVTSPTGAVFHDIANVINRRYPLVELILAPTPVQGNGAPEGIVRALRALNDMEDIDVVIVARGGGSLEELWAFNEEKVARAIYASCAPVISGVGHETDFTIADYVADLRAPTPSAAAELATPDCWELRSRIDLYKWDLLSSISSQLSSWSDEVGRRQDRLEALSPDLKASRQRVDELSRGAWKCLEGLIAVRRQCVESLAAQLNSLSPANTLARGYAVVKHTARGEVISRTGQVRVGDNIEVRVTDGAFRGEVVEGEGENG
ncbi:MAG: exodeoxyribonuclease VII large subunit [Chloroflexi bacterium RBG_13_54_9]|nr:MAG: exodeoxyribonuclease VII large subunit [Chloroflexi bacterium RBG_13_54_9]